MATANRGGLEVCGKNYASNFSGNNCSSGNRVGCDGAMDVVAWTGVDVSGTGPWTSRGLVLSEPSSAMIMRRRHRARTAGSDSGLGQSLLHLPHLARAGGLPVGVSGVASEGYVSALSSVLWASMTHH